MNPLDQLRHQAFVCHSSGQLEEAEQLYRHLLDVQPQADVAGNLGAVLRSLGRLAEAETHYAWALRAFPNDPSVVVNACNLLRDLGRATETIPILKSALAQDFHHFGLRQALALSFHHCGQLDDAIHLQQQLLDSQPANLISILEYGACLAKQGHRSKALEQFDRALSLDPQNPQAQANKIAMLVDFGRLDEASQCLAQAEQTGLHPRLIGAEAGLAAARNDQEKALALHLKLTTLEPHNADHWLHVAASQLELRQMVAPLYALQQALKLAPHRHDLQLMLGRLLVEHGNTRQGLDLLCAGSDNPDASDTVHTIFQFAAAGHRLLPADQLRQRMSVWEQRRRLKPSELWRDRIRDPDPDRRLRVGYLSPDFCNHPVGRFVQPIFSAHNRGSVEVVGLSVGKIVDSVHQQLKDSCSSWHDLRFCDDHQMARFIADLNLDILIDLGGHTANQRLRPLTAKPAPIQLGYLGYPASTYLSCMDGIIGDHVLFGPLQPFETGPHESLLPLPRCYLAFQPPEHNLRLERCAPDRRFRFGSFNHSRKYSDRCLDLFAAVLQAVPNSLLVLKSISFVEGAERERIQARFAQRGISSERLDLLEWVQGFDHHLELYGLMDVALDTLPYSGTTTTCEALWMGVPVLTLLGEVMVERQSASVLAGAGLGSAIARDEHDFVRRARLIANQGPRFDQHRLALREHVAASDLCDVQTLVHELEALYRNLWQAREFGSRL